ncbi:hypothetical protein D3C80_1771940 [compost metagenome]
MYQNQAFYKADTTWPDPRGWWNPFADDSDALRLAIVMGRMDRLAVGIHIVEPFDGETGPYTWIDAESFGAFIHYHVDDPFTATRRTVVEAAAEIGRRS